MTKKFVIFVIFVIESNVFGALVVLSATTTGLSSPPACDLQDHEAASSA
jgi:hypothetical protein